MVLGSCNEVSTQDSGGWMPSFTFFFFLQYKKEKSYIEVKEDSINLPEAIY